MHAHGREAPIDVAVAAAEQVAVCGAQVTVEEGVDEGVHERVGVAEPEQSALQPGGATAAKYTAGERPHRGENEEGQPAHGEDAHDHPKRGGCLLLATEDRGAAPLVVQQPSQCRPLFTRWPWCWGQVCTLLAKAPS